MWNTDYNMPQVMEHEATQECNLSFLSWHAHILELAPPPQDPISIAQVTLAGALGFLLKYK